MKIEERKRKEQKKNFFHKVILLINPAVRSGLACIGPTCKFKSQQSGPFRLEILSVQLDFGLKLDQAGLLTILVERNIDNLYHILSFFNLILFRFQKFNSIICDE